MKEILFLKTSIVLSSQIPSELRIYATSLKKCFFGFLKKRVSIITVPYTAKRIVLLKSPHVNKKSKEHFYLPKHKITLVLYCSSKEFLLVKLILMCKPKNINSQLILQGGCV